MKLRFLCAVACALLAGLTPRLLAQNAQNYSPNERILLIRDLARKNAQAIPAIAQYLTDPDRDVRLEAVKAIVKLDTPASLTPLIQATHDNDPEIQIRATDGLVNDYLPGYVAKSGLSGTLTRGVRQAKAFFNSRNDQVIDPGTEVRPDVAEALAGLITGGASVEVRANAARAAGILRARGAVPALEKAVNSKETPIIFESLVALEKIGDPSAGPSLSFLALDLDPHVQIAALETIGVLQSKESAPQVRSALRGARNEKVRRAALQALAMLGLPADHSIFLEYAHNPDASLRASAIEGLGRIREPEDEQLLESAFNERNSDPKIHLAAAFALVDEGNVATSEFSPLAYLMENLGQPGRSEPAKAYLKELCQREDVRKAVFSLVPQATKDQKVALCSIFGSIHTPDVIPILNNLSHDIDPDVSYAAIRALHQAQNADRPRVASQQ
jgi:HEAT repeat protein